MTDPTPTTPPPGLPTSDERRPPYLWATTAGALIFALYAATLSRTTAFWDTSEYIATAWIMGIPHPPGNPLFVVLARAWTILLEPTGLSVAIRVNLFSAFMSAAAHAFWFLVFHHILRFFSEDRRFRLIGTFISVLVSATAFSVWNQSNVNEKVYTVSLFTIALLTWLIFRWQERIGKGKDDNFLVLIVFVLALSVGNHLMAFLAAPAIGIFILLSNPKSLFNWRLYPSALVAVLLGLSIHLFLPIRAELDPIINEGAPECATLTGAIVSTATYGQAGCAALSSSINREQYKSPGQAGPGLTGERQAPPGAQYLNFLQYFDWQWSRSLQGTDTVFPPMRLLFTMLFTGLGVWGAMEHHRRDARSFWYMATLFGTLSIGLVWYLNFKYGYTMPIPIEDRALREVRERDYFFIVSFSLWGLWAGLGISAIWQTLSQRAGTLLRASPILLIAFMPMTLNASWATRHQDYAARDWAYNLLQSVEPYGVLFTNGDNDTFPLWYLQEVEEIRQDVTVIVISYLNTNWYAKQLRDLTRPCPPGVSAADTPTRIICQRPWTSDGRAVYTADPSTVTEGTPLVLTAPIEPPKRSVLADLDDATIDSIATQFFSAGPQAVRVPLGPVEATIPAGTMIQPWHRLALSVIANAIGDRPIYFASSGGTSTNLGLDRFVVRQGLAFKLYSGDPAADTTGRFEPMPPESGLTVVTGEWVDMQRTARLMDDVFMHRGGIPEWDHWPDHSTVGIPNYYSWGYLALVQAALNRGDDEGLDRWRNAAEAWSELGRQIPQ
ncbi:MAG: DUF2723 domain-containing protein [Longimicrobiales bacterium]|nr:DUF2723 domain-containing protein [Longimicrobiales bacterium]